MPPLGPEIASLRLAIFGQLSTQLAMSKLTFCLLAEVCVAPHKEPPASAGGFDAAQSAEAKPSGDDRGGAGQSFKVVTVNVAVPSWLPASSKLLIARHLGGRQFQAVSVGHRLSVPRWYAAVQAVTSPPA